MTTQAKNMRTHQEKSKIEHQISKPTKKKEDAVAKLYINGKHSANELYKEGKKKLSETQGALENYAETAIQSIKRRPLSTLVIAGGIGFVLGFLLQYKK